MYYNGCFFTKNPSQALSGKTMFLNIASKRHRKLRRLQLFGGGSAAGGGSPYNLRLLPKASGKDTGSVAGARSIGR